MSALTIIRLSIVQHVRTLAAYWLCSKLNSVHDGFFRCNVLFERFCDVLRIPNNRTTLLYACSYYHKTCILLRFKFKSWRFHFLYQYEFCLSRFGLRAQQCRLPFLINRVFMYLWFRFAVLRASHESNINRFKCYQSVRALHTSNNRKCYDKRTMPDSLNSIATHRCRPVLIFRG